MSIIPSLSQARWWWLSPLWENLFIRWVNRLLSMMRLPAQGQSVKESHTNPPNDLGVKLSRASLDSLNSKALNNFCWCGCSVLCRRFSFRDCRVYFSSCFWEGCQLTVLTAVPPTLPGAASIQQCSLLSTQNNSERPSQLHCSVRGRLRPWLRLHCSTSSFPSQSCFFRSPSCLRFRFWQHSPISHLHTKLHLRICFLGNPFCNIWLPLFLSSYIPLLSCNQN